MSNDHFNFKQFKINHQKCAMKVSTDGVLLGAWTKCEQPVSILDIGTGTGLLALMMAQKNQHAAIDAIEIDKDAWLQSTENFSNSPWSDRINASNISLQDFTLDTLSKYDLIISNPPYFEKSLVSDDRSRTLARHTNSLTPEVLIRSVSFLLNPTGHFSCIYPVETGKKLILEAHNYNLFCSRQTLVIPTPQKNPNRILIELSPQKKEPAIDYLYIRETSGDLSDAFKKLTRDFYLDN